MMSKKRQKRNEFIVSGYTRYSTKKYAIDISSEIMSIIFMFYYIEFFDFEYGKKIKVKGNIITNNSTSYWTAFLNTTFIGCWMDPNSENQQIHTIRIKVIKMRQRMLIGIVCRENYKVDEDIIGNLGYNWRSNGFVNCNHSVDEYGAGDEVIITLDLRDLSLCYKVIKKNNEELSGVLRHRIKRAKYKWAVSMDDLLDCFEVIDMY